jgi:hypothetical protein
MPFTIPPNSRRSPYGGSDVFRLDRALEAYRRAGSLNDRVNLFGFIDDCVFLSKSGDVGLILAVKGVFRSACGIR